MASPANTCASSFTDDFGTKIYPHMLPYSVYMARYYFFLEGV